MYKSEEGDIQLCIRAVQIVTIVKTLFTGEGCRKSII